MLPSYALGQANGKLQIHFMDVWQGDGAILISPEGDTVLFDNGNYKDCDRPVNYLKRLGVEDIDYHIASHYHADHIGCTEEVLDDFPLTTAAYDRGGNYRSKSYDEYVKAVGTLRRTATAGMQIKLDEGAAQQVLIDIPALSGAGIETVNENDLSVVAVVRFGNFDAVIAGDLSGFDTGYYEDIETMVAPKVGQVEVYKVNHHGSRYSSNSTWLKTLNPRIGVISVGDHNGYGHPTRECLERLHAYGVKTFWTQDGDGDTDPAPGTDVVGGDIVVEYELGDDYFTVTHSGGQVATFPIWQQDDAPPAKYAWSKRSKLYHYAECRYVKNIKPKNFQQGDSPPQGKSQHDECPK
ncbi:MAG TPA: MBL fold metallo-hydrolase [Acidobacteriota bacterium]|nr:MBL fold metallo-hydrolase [Acidobacteriota bacterium]